jgi:GNAT superfamily N-acetyltransferase
VNRDRPTAATIRAAATGDVPAIRAILAAHGNDDPPDRLRGPDIVGPYLNHLLAWHRVMVSELPDAGVVAFGAVVDAGIAWHLADLFVDPERLGQGLGRPLLAAIYGARQPRTTFASDDPRALPLYVRAGMAAQWVALYLRGGRETARRAAADRRVRALEVVSGEPAELASLELAWTGADRVRDYELWTAWSGSDPFVVRDADGPVAVGSGRDRQNGPAARAVDRLVVRPGVEPVGPVLASIARCLASGTSIAVTIPGRHPALPVLLELGLRIEDRDVYCAGPLDPLDPSRRLVHGGLL